MTDNETYPKRARHGEALTPREADVLRSIAETGKSSDTATALGLSKRTVDFHLGNVYTKYGVTNRIKAIQIAQKNGDI